MSDEGRLLYTGHLSVHPMVEVPDGLGREPREVELRWTASAPGFEVLALDGQAADELTWSRPDVDARSGTYLYVGHIEPLVTDALTAVVDPGMPQWMQEQVLERLPAQLARFEERTGLGLGHRPLVLASWDPEGRGTSLKGGSLTGLLQLHAGGEGWVAGDEDERVRWAWFLAHEGFHLWNGQRYGRASDSGRWEEWLSEGLSDRYALHALLDDGLIDAAEAHRRIVADANRCLVGAESDPLLRQTHPYGTWYACGQVSLFLLDHQLQQAGSSLDAVLNAWWSRSEQVGGWTTTSLIDEVQRTLGDPTAVGWWTELLYSGLDAPERVLSEALMQAGVPVSTVAPAEAPVPAWVCEMGLERVASSCGCGLSVDRSADLVTAELAGCDATLTAVGEHALSDALCDAWLAARDQAATGRWDVGEQALSCTLAPGWSALLELTP
jgi:hypothetical protein